MIHHLGGTVKNGVIMPDFPVPDNTYVEIVVPNATREILNRVRRKAMNPAGEQTIVSERKGVHLVMESDVPEFLRYNDAENGFDNRLDLIISFFLGSVRVHRNLGGRTLRPRIDSCLDSSSTSGWALARSS